MKKLIVAVAFLAPLMAQSTSVENLAKLYDEDGIRSAPAHAHAEKQGHAAGKGHGEESKGHGDVDAWGRLMAGNLRHQKGAWKHPNLNVGRREEQAKGQKPFAAVLSCADSRVPTELVFDQGLGDLFVVRVAGNVAGPFDRASLEYGVEHLGIGLLLVLGHERCGAVKAALDTSLKPGSEEGLTPDLKALVHEISPSVKGKGEGQLDEAVQDNAKLSLKSLLSQSAVLKQAVEAGHLKVKAARYDLESGKVEALD